MERVTVCCSLDMGLDVKWIQRFGISGVTGVYILSSDEEM